MLTRRELLKYTASGAAVLPLTSSSISRAFASAQTSPATADALAARRRQLAAVPITITRLTPMIIVYSGPGGNVTVRAGEEGKVVVDTFVRGAFPALKARLDAFAQGPILNVVNTHWHFDHTDNNNEFRALGVQVVAHENVKRRLSETHDLLGMHITPAPAEAMPTRTVGHHSVISFDLPGTEEYIDIVHLEPAHTDTDVSVHFPFGDVLVLGDVFSNGSYPFIDASTGGKVKGIMAAIEDALRVGSASTQIVPGHGPVGDRAALIAYRDMLGTVIERVQKLKAAGVPEQDVIARAPSKEFDAKWASPVVTPAAFVSNVYNTI